MSFVHLHCHTEYSLLDGAIRIKDLVAQAKAHGAPAAAITDHGNLYGALTFYTQCQKEGIQPILGCEVYVAGREIDHTNRDPEHARNRHHLVLLAKNETGWQNLVKLVSIGHLHGFYHKPRVDLKLLSQYNEGLVALSACLAGAVPRAMLRQGMDAAIETAREYASIFPGRFFLEIQANDLPEQARLNTKLIELADVLKLPLIATNDCHYLTKEDVDAHDVLLCIQTAACVDDPKRMRFETRDLYFKSPEEMRAAFPHCPEAIENSLRIADMCHVKLDLKSHHFPRYELPEGRTVSEEFQRLAREGLEARLRKMPYAVEEDAYRQRLETELQVIGNMGFEGYFLIVQDFINWAKDHGIPVGPGRGSAAGSLVAWALRITNIDPIPYNLLFERFLNPERVSMPDIDVDFCERRRTEVIRYVSEKYGSDSVAQITTFGTMKAKAVIKDVGRALGMSFAETDRIAKLVPDDLKMTIKKALEQSQDLAQLQAADPRIARLLNVSQRLEGLCRHASTHAAGVVIGDRPLSDRLPLYRGKREEIVTQFDMKMVEKIGLIKFDFLGLRTMTVIQDTLDSIGRQGKPVPDLDTLPLDDPREETWKLFQRGDTDGVFQVESSGMRKYLRMLKPTCFDDLIAMLALYRPGPLNSGMVDEFIDRKHGRKRVEYPWPSLKECLKPTYGVIVYQEQVMQIAQIVAGYTLGGADLLRRAMGKKNAEEMATQRAIFVEGAAKNGVPEKKANEIFDLMEKFAEYGFNKSHSAAYALVSYWTAWLKTHYPAEFMAALMTSELGNQDKLLQYIAACKDMKDAQGRSLEVRPPDVNASRREFSVQDHVIFFGLGGVKNVGDEAINSIVAAREAEGPFVSLLDFLTRIDLRKANKRVLESLIKCGALCSLGATERALFESLEQAISRAQKKAKEKDDTIVSLFSLAPAEAAPPPMPGVGFDCPEACLPEWPAEILSRYEKEALGFFLSNHPLMPFRRQMQRLQLTPLEECRGLPDRRQVRVAAMITSLKEHLTKKGDKMAFCQIEDLGGSAEATFFPRTYEAVKALLLEEKPLLLTALIDDKDGAAQANGDAQGDDDAPPTTVKLLVEEAQLLELAVAACTEPVRLQLPAARLDNGGLAAFKALLQEHEGDTPVRLRLLLDNCICDFELDDRLTVDPTPAFEQAMDRFCKGLS
ncbi:MAG: DNA polymerase III subunit alpha [Desulfovibrio sp.]|nr:DNA polymerase III subunit alpha [Desulfovibrio sp.]MCA1986473.1 DNA polymerase III subunit alpha [Desulfovibrio sp.]